MSVENFQSEYVENGVFFEGWPPGPHLHVTATVNGEKAESKVAVGELMAEEPNWRELAENHARLALEDLARTVAEQ
jgi:hypothetical protein